MNSFITVHAVQSFSMIHSAMKNKSFRNEKQLLTQGILIEGSFTHSFVASKFQLPVGFVLINSTLW